jgi:hypothetical protein
MPIFASNFTSNSLSGSITTAAGFANVILTSIPYALEGNKTFVIKIRRDSIDGLVLATTPTITLQDNSTLVSVTANTSIVGEGNLVSFTVITANAANNANLFYSILPVTANVTADDFTANTGRFTVANNVGTIVLKANADVSLMDETGETFKLQVRTVSTTGDVVNVSSNVEIVDNFKTINVLSLLESSTAATEDVPITFTFSATNVPTGTVLYYTTSGNTSFSSGTGSFVMNGLSNTITLTPISVPSLQTRAFALQIRKDSVSGEVIRTSNNIIASDSGLVYTVATGGTLIETGDGFRTHVFTSSGNLVISSVGTTFNTLEYQVVAGGGGGADGYMDQGGGGGGAGGLIYSNNIIAVASTMPVIVGAGGSPAGYDQKATNGTPSVFNANTAIGGGGGGGKRNQGSGGIRAGDGGSGGGGMYATYPPGGGVDRGTGTPGQGNPGGESMYSTPFGGYTMNAGGGGGAGSRGYTWNDGTWSSAPTANVGGGIGLVAMSVPDSYGTPGPAPGRYFAGGGGGGFANRPGANMVPGPGSAGGGGEGAGRPGTPSGGPGINGTTNTGGGGGGGSYPSYYTIYPGRTGGSGIVIVRYPYGLTSYTNLLVSSNIITNSSNLVLTMNAISANTRTFYYTTEGNVTVADFVNGNTGSFVGNIQGGVFSLRANATIPLGEQRKFAIQIRDGSITGDVKLTSANVTMYNSTDLNHNATGGNIFLAGGYKTHVFTTSNTFVMSSLSTVLNNQFEVLIVGGGGGGGYGGGGGGGKIMYRTDLAIPANSYSIELGAGGSINVNGANTTAFGVLSIGGGAGGSGSGRGGYGGSGGGGGGSSGSIDNGLSISTPVAGWNEYGNHGGVGANYQRGGGGDAGDGGGGGGGAGGAGQNAWLGLGNSPPSLRSGGGFGGSGYPASSLGGILSSTPLSGSFISAGGSGGGQGPGGPNGGGQGRGQVGPGGQAWGAGGFFPGTPGEWNGGAGATNTGGGSGGGKSPYQANTGGSGVVVVRYPFF